MGNELKYDLRFLRNPDELAGAVARELLDRIALAQRESRQFFLALSGGRITRNLFAAVTTLARGSAPEARFNNVHFFWADERCLPPSDSESNFRTADDLLFQPLRIPSEQIHRIQGEHGPHVAAQVAEEEIQRIIPARSNGQPVLDVVLLGLGEDGHTASLFPGEDPASVMNPAVYRAVLNSPKPPPERVTLGYAAIASAREAWMVASGNGKETALRESLTAGGTPFGQVLQQRGRTLIFSDISVG